MRSTLRRVGQVATSAGSVRLRMSVGIHTGAVDLFLAGREHRELIVTGPVATATEAMEAAADAGEIVVSPVTAEHLPEGCIGATKGPGVLLTRSPPVTAWTSPGLPALGDFDPGLFVPPVLRRHLLAGGHDPEHRQATVAFLWFSGVDRLLSEEGAAVVGSRLDELMGTVERHFARHDICLLGSDLYKDGGKLLAVAGAPDSHEDDEERMLRAVRSLPEEAPADLSIRVGVHRGPLYAGQIGPSFRRTYTVMGDAVNTAARVMAHAEPGTVLTTDDVLRASRTEFVTEALPPFVAKGKAQPLHTFRVGARVGARGTSDVLPLVGREA
jgi:class 3 adenylate cyclase